MINAPSGGAQEKAPRWVARVQKVAVVELGFCRAPGCLGGTWIYIGETSTSVEQWGAHEGGGRTQGGRRAPCLVGPSVLHRRTPSSYIYTRTPKRSEQEAKT